jgi:hypothetical protein
MQWGRILYETDEEIPICSETLHAVHCEFLENKKNVPEREWGRRKYIKNKALA